MSKVGIVPDIHLGHENSNRDVTEEALEALNVQFSDIGIDRVVLLGDLVQEEDRMTDKAKLARLYEIFGNKEVYATPGNHDVMTLETEDFVSVFDDTHVSQFSLADGVECILTDTSSESNVTHVGKLSDVSLRFIQDAALVDDTVDELVVLSHYLLGYTDQYSKTQFFSEYPEGVFAVNKAHVEEAFRESNASDIHCVSGHIHANITPYKAQGARHHVLNSFVDLYDDTETDVLGHYGVLDYDDGIVIQQKQLSEYPQ